MDILNILSLSPPFFGGPFTPVPPPPTLQHTITLIAEDRSERDLTARA